MSRKNFQIKGIESTTDLLTGRAGLASFQKYLNETGLLDCLSRKFSSLKKNSKGLSVSGFFNQMLCWLMDGTSRHISSFNQLKNDEAYAATIGTSEQIWYPHIQLRGYVRKGLLACL